MLLFRYFSPLMAYGSKNELNPCDVPPPHKGSNSVQIQKAFALAYEKEVTRWRQNRTCCCCSKPKYPSVVRTILRAHGRNLLIGNLWCVLWTVSSLVTPFAVRVLLKNIAAGGTEENAFLGISNPWWLATIIFFCQFMQSLGYNQCCAFVAFAGVTMRGSLITAVYRKSLRLTSQSRQQSTSGEMVNMMSNDAVRVWKACQIGHFAWAGFLMTIAVMVILVFEVGLAGGLAGAGLLSLITPLVLFLSRYQGILRRRMLKSTDERVKVMGEVLSGIRVVKSYNWQNPLADKVQSIRNAEILISFQSHLLNGGSKIIMYLSPSFVMLLVFGVYSSNGGTMEVSLVLTVLAFLNSVKFPMNVMPFAAQSIAEALVSAERIGRFLSLEELDHVAQFNFGAGDSLKHNNIAAVVATAGKKIDDTSSDVVIRVSNGLFTWGSENDHPTLSNINLCVKRGELVGIVGSVGSGKSSLILALLKEMHLLNGHMAIRGTVAYCSQQAWIRNATVQDNILFGLPFVDALYNQVLKACALKSDLKALAGGDGAEIGERGVNLSGGQKARVSLARALYLSSDRDVFLLDDPLSAVDEETATHIFERAISSDKAMLKNKTILLVMNSHLHLLQAVDKVLVMEKGKIKAFGTLNQVSEECEWLKEFAVKNTLPLVEEQKIATPTQIEIEIETAAAAAAADIVEVPKIITSIVPAVLKEKTKQPTTITLVQKEDRVKGHVRADVYFYYFGQAWPGHGVGLAILVVAVFILSEVIRIVGDFMLSTYSDAGAPPDTWIAPYAGIVGGASALALMRIVVFTSAAVFAGKNLHNNLFRAILGAHVTHFFDVTPSGRILNRFAGDLDQIDGLLPRFFLMLLEKITEMIGVIVMCVISTPYFIILFIPLGLIFYWCMQYYRSTNRALKRLESVSRSPVLSLFEETVNGLDSIRGYGVSDKFEAQMRTFMDINTSSYWFYYLSGRWLSVRLDLISCFVVYAAALAIVGFQDTISIVAAGLALVYAMMMTAKLQAVVRNFVDVEGYMVSVERMRHYSTCEMEATDFKITPHHHWPQKGKICFTNVSMRYRKGLPLVLQGLNLEIFEGEKVGICGRTGAGKSSIMVSLLRLVEVAGGTIEIDGLNVADIPLGKLRNGCAIIPQDPVLFSGTVRFNLDPFNNYTDVQVWKALEEVQLVERITSDPLALEALVAESGSNFSVGESQLICIARALLRRSKVVLLDEATASCDGRTDDLIQNVMRTAFTDATVLTIAHRLETIIFYDKIAVISEGKIAEYATPKELLSNKDSAFFKLVNEMGEEAAQRMHQHVGLY